MTQCWHSVETVTTYGDGDGEETETSTFTERKIFTVNSQITSAGAMETSQVALEGGAKHQSSPSGKRPALHGGRYDPSTSTLMVHVNQTQAEAVGASLSTGMASRCMQPSAGIRRPRTSGWSRQPPSWPFVGLLQTQRASRLGCSAIASTRSKAAISGGTRGSGRAGVAVNRSWPIPTCGWSWTRL